MSWSLKINLSSTYSMPFGVSYLERANAQGHSPFLLFPRRLGCRSFSVSSFSFFLLAFLFQFSLAFCAISVPVSLLEHNLVKPLHSIAESRLGRMLDPCIYVSPFNPEFQTSYSTSYMSGYHRVYYFRTG
ncbi:hypothetical protein ACN38_g9984 [Penicillium nordicum]|uniref:Uncharacterized protein n=1 Tax=Penicillium nordicum TaxID=229535 RepID=A0A0M8NXA5_9EURO|nr:hypothetical protein ACN38_g9984 [Penicillium nordicum]